MKFFFHPNWSERMWVYSLRNHIKLEITLYGNVKQSRSIRQTFQLLSMLTPRKSASLLSKGAILCCYNLRRVRRWHSSIEQQLETLSNKFVHV